MKSSFRLGYLESVPEVSAKLKAPETKERRFEDVVKSAEPTAVLVLDYRLDCRESTQRESFAFCAFFCG